MKAMITNLGYPRMGEQRQWKTALDMYWSGALSKEELQSKMNGLCIANWTKQAELGIELIPVGDFSLYDHVLDHSFAFGIVPERFHEAGADPLACYFSMARGSEGIAASRIAPWFETNYHYVVPELAGDMKPRLSRNYWLQQAQEAAAALQLPLASFKPVIIGPYTYVSLAQIHDPVLFAGYVSQLIPVYSELIAELAAAGIAWVQIDEPALVQELAADDLLLLEQTYAELRKHASGMKLLLQTYYDGARHAQQLLNLPVDGIGLDFVHDDGANLAVIALNGFPEDKVLSAGIVDGRNIWRADLSAAWNTVRELLKYVPSNRLALSPSCSLLHVPVSLKHEAKRPELAKLAAAFADEKLQELRILARGVREGHKAIALDLADSDVALQAFAESPFRSRFTEGLDSALEQHHQALQPVISF